MIGMLTITKQSGWEFVTFGSGGLSVGFVAAEGGTVVLKDLSGEERQFYYGGAGGGLSAGLKIPKIGKVRIKSRAGDITGNVGPTAFPSTGALFVTDNCSGDDLTESEIQGPCAFIDVGAGLIAGASGTAMAVGLNPLYLMALAAGPMATPFAAQLLISSAKGVLLMAGLNVGIQAQIGGAALLGYLH